MRVTESGMVQAPVSVGELLDKITILEIKAERIADEGKLVNVKKELSALNAVAAAAFALDAAGQEIMAALRQVNSLLWDVEDEIRDCERNKDFGSRFIELARSVYRHNDRRALLKKQLNELTGSQLHEEKSYADYGP